MTAKKQNLSLSDLISEMRNIIHNNDRFCFSDFTWDIETLISMQEKRNGFIQYWSIRENGTKIADSYHEVECWASSCNSQGIYKIIFEKGFYSIESK